MNKPFHVVKDGVLGLAKNVAVQYASQNIKGNAMLYVIIMMEHRCYMQ